MLLRASVLDMDKSTAEHQPDWYTAEELAAEYGVTPATIRRWAAEGTIPTRPLPARGRRYGRPAVEVTAA